MCKFLVVAGAHKEVAGLLQLIATHQLLASVTCVRNHATPHITVCCHTLATVEYSPRFDRRVTMKRLCRCLKASVTVKAPQHPRDLPQRMLWAAIRCRAQDILNYVAGC